MVKLYASFSSSSRRELPPYLALLSCPISWAHYKLDIRGFFMHINRPLLVELLDAFLARVYPHPDRAALMDLCRSVVLNDPLFAVNGGVPQNSGTTYPLKKASPASPTTAAFPSATSRRRYSPTSTWTVSTTSASAS
jgi:hypothetical protein